MRLTSSWGILSGCDNGSVLMGQPIGNGRIAQMGRSPALGHPGAPIRRPGLSVAVCYISTNRVLFEYQPILTKCLSIREFWHRLKFDYS